MRLFPRNASLVGRVGPALRTLAGNSTLGVATGTLVLGILAAIPPGVANPLGPTPASPQEAERPDLLTLAHGAVPLSIGGAGAGLGADLTHAVRFIDGDPWGFTVVNRANAETDTEVVYALPAPTTFHRLAVPGVLETPSPAQTFTRTVEVYGSAEGPEGPWKLLASRTLETHSARGQVTELDVLEHRPVSWVRLRLVGGIEMLQDRMFIEFSEIIGNGTQETPALVDSFQGAWWDRGVRLSLSQDGPAVTGCYDDGSRLTGTVTGNILKATGIGRGDGVVSQFILGVTENGQIRGVRSTNGAPFALYSGETAQGRRLECDEPPVPALGCGSVIHGITFDFDSAALRPESAPVLEKLAEGLADGTGRVSIEGHTSSEGGDAYNQDLSARRSQAVVRDLIARGIDAGRVGAVGHGESAPIASNDTENGRAMNRRVEVRCAGG